MKTRAVFTCLFFILLAACAGGIDNTSRVMELTPFIPSATPTFPNLTDNTPTPLPAPTPTPIIHVVVAGETISGIALQYGVETAAVLAANPLVSPNTMSVGTKLLIPSTSTSKMPAPGSSPEPLTPGSLNCLPSGYGVWCFLPILNDLDYPVENITARIIIANSQTGQLADQISSSPLNILYPDSSIALAAYFDIPIGNPIQSSYELLSALAVKDGQTRYLSTSLENVQTSINPGGLSALVSGEVALLDASHAASQVWVAAVAYDAQGAVVGVRRWESSSLPAGQRLPFSFQIYSAGGSILKIDLLVEAHK